MQQSDFNASAFEKAIISRHACKKPYAVDERQASIIGKLNPKTCSYCIPVPQFCLARCLDCEALLAVVCVGWPGCGYYDEHHLDAHIDEQGIVMADLAAPHGCPLDDKKRELEPEPDASEESMEDWQRDEDPGSE